MQYATLVKYADEAEKINNGKVSVTMIQRKLKLTYDAAREIYFELLRRQCLEFSKLRRDYEEII